MPSQGTDLIWATRPGVSPTVAGQPCDVSPASEVVRGSLLSALLGANLLPAGTQSGAPPFADPSLLGIDTSADPQVLLANDGGGNLAANWVAATFADIHPASATPLDGSAPLADYAELRGLTVDRLDGAYRVLGPRGGVFEIVTDTAANVTAALAQDAGEGVNVALTNGGGTKYARRQFDGPVYVTWFESTGGDDAAAVQHAIDYLEAQVNSGGSIKIPTGEYTWQSTPVVSEHGISVIGDGAGNVSNIFPLYDGPTEIIIDQVTGPGIHFMGMDCEISKVGMTCSATRQALTFGLMLPMVLVASADTGNGQDRSDRFCSEGLRIDSNPGDGIALVAGCAESVIKNAEIIDCKGMGVRLDSGLEYGRANIENTALIQIINPRIVFCGGNAISISSPSATTQEQMGVRIKIVNLDTFGVANDPAVRYSNDTVWMFAENSAITYSGFGGDGWDGTNFITEARGGIFVAGRDNRLINNRYVRTTQPVTVGNITAQPTRGITVDTVRTVQSAVIPTELVTVEFGAENVHVRIDDTVSAFSTVMTPRVPGSTYTVLGNHGPMSASNYNSGAEMTIADDAVAVLDFEIVGQASGLIALTGTNLSSGGGQFQFRIGNSPAISKWGGQANTDGMVGILTGTTGPDAMLNVGAGSDGKIYIENRRGFPIVINAHISTLARSARLIE